MTKEQPMIYKTLRRKLNTEKNGREVKCLWRINSFYLTSGTRRTIHHTRMFVSLFLNVEWKLNLFACLAILSPPCVTVQQSKCPKNAYWSSAYPRSWNKPSSYSEWTCVLLNVKLAIIPLICHSENEFKYR